MGGRGLAPLCTAIIRRSELADPAHRFHRLTRLPLGAALRARHLRPCILIRTDAFAFADLAGLIESRVHAAIDQLAHHLPNDHVDNLVHGLTLFCLVAKHTVKSVVFRAKQQLIFKKFALSLSRLGIFFTVIAHRRQCAQWWTVLKQPG